MATTFTIEAHPVETRTGLWCDTCMLPSAVCVTVAIAASDSLRVLGRVIGEHCEGCGQTEVTR